MEDFGSVIWTLIVVGLGIYSMVAQSRKKKTEAAPKQHGHGEAWPSWTQETDDEAEEATTTASRQEYIPMQPEFEEGTDAEPVYAEQMQAEPAFDDESKYSAAGYEALSSNVNNKGVCTPEASRITEKKTNDLLSEKPHSQPEANKDTSAELEFDLRKAIIYSEILKPKFEE